MTGELPYDKILQESLKGELRLLNAHLPSQQKSLSDLSDEQYPHVLCNDGSTHLFKKKELAYLSGMLDTKEQQLLLLPMLIEVDPSQSEAAIICKQGIEEKVVSEVLGMPAVSRHGRVTIYKSQLGVLRKALKTTTQYIFSTKVLA